MMNMTTGAAGSGLSPVVNMTSSRSIRSIDKFSSVNGNNLPRAGKIAPHIQPSAKPRELLESVEKINAFVQGIQRDLSINLDTDSGQTVIKVIDRDSGDTIRQIPSEEALAIARHIGELRGRSSDVEISAKGIFFSERI